MARRARVGHPRYHSRGIEIRIEKRHALEITHASPIAAAADSPVRMLPMAETPPGAPPAASFETCLDELEKVVKELEAGDLSLDRSLELFERGVGLSDAFRKQLEEAETRVEMLIRRDGKMVAEPFRPEKSGT